MKLAIASFSTALLLATSASAMTGPYERMINAQVAAGELVSGEQETIEVTTTPSGPSVDWSESGEKSVTVFESNPENYHAAGYESR